MIAYFNGGFLQKNDIHISPDDRGFLFADGVYEVTAVINSRLIDYAHHMERLARSLQPMSRDRLPMATRWCLRLPRNWR